MYVVEGQVTFNFTSLQNSTHPCTIGRLFLNYRSSPLLKKYGVNIIKIKLVGNYYLRRIKYSNHSILVNASSSAKFNNYIEK